MSERLPDQFSTTHWSLVIAAGHRALPEADEALATLCSRYWYPLYAYLRRRTYSEHEAQDLTQAFFARLLERNTLAAAEPTRGRFRAFLLTSLKNFVADQRDHGVAQKRGGGQTVLRFDFDSGESRFRLEPAHELTPERLFERDWALAVLNTVTARLEAEFAAQGQSAHFAHLKPFLAGATGDERYSDLAAVLAMTPAAARQAAHRLRRRFRELLRTEVTETLADPCDVDDELRRLFASVAAK